MNVNSEQIIELDRLNMAPVLEKVGGVFDSEKRRTGISDEICKGAVFITIERANRVAAYLEYSPESNGDIYVKSLQIHPDYQGRAMIRQLLRRVYFQMNGLALAKIKSSVHRANVASLALHRKLGFKAVELNEEKIWFEIDGADLVQRLQKFVREK